MKFNEIVAVSKLPGLYLIHKQRADGLILKSLVDDKIFFAASRSHTYTPLENITIYTQNDPIELETIFWKMKESLSKTSLPSLKAESSELKAYFQNIVSDYDQERVYTSDIQKIIKWFGILNEKNLIQKPTSDNSAQAEDSLEEKTTETEAISKPKAKATKKKKTEE